MKFNKIALVLAGVVAVGGLTGCGGKNVYKSEDGSLVMNLPSDQWVPLAEGEPENGGAYAFELSADAENTDPLYDSEDENSLAKNIIIFQSMSAEEGTLAYDSIPVTEDALIESLGETFEYEVIEFEGDDKDGVKKNLYIVKVPTSESLGDETTEDATGEDSETVETTSYIVARTEADEEGGFIIAAQLVIKNDGEDIGSTGEKVLEDVKKSLETVKYDADAKASEETTGEEVINEELGDTTTAAAE